MVDSWAAGVGNASPALPGSPSAKLLAPVIGEPGAPLTAALLDRKGHGGCSPALRRLDEFAGQPMRGGCRSKSREHDRFIDQW